MFILPRYLIRQHIGPFIFGLSVIIFIFLSNFIFQNLYKFIGKGLSLWTILEVITLNMAWILALAIPIAVLIATVMTFGRLSEENEITALRSGGIGPFQIMRPVLLAATLLSAGLIWFNNIVLPEANHRARLLMSDIYRAKPALSFEEGVFSAQMPDMRVLIQKIDPNSPGISDIIIFDNSEAPLRRTIVAESGSFVFVASENKFILTLQAGEIHEINPEEWNHYQRLRFDKHIIAVPMEGSGFHRTQKGYRGDREKSAQAMSEEIALTEEEIRGYHNTADRIIQDMNIPLTSPLGETIDSLTALVTNTESSSGKSAQSSPLSAAHNQQLQESLEQLQNLSALIQARSDYVQKLAVEVHKKYSIPVACIIFILVGAPLGMMVRKGGMAISGGVSLGFVIIYWAFLIGGEELADRGMVPPTVMWAPNILLGLLGSWWTFRISRVSSLFSPGSIFHKFKRKEA